MRDINHTRLAPYISAARLRTYSTFFNPADPVELFGCYLWSKEVAAAFFPLLQVLEVTLRNAIHNEAHQKLGAYWFDNIATKPKLNGNQHRLVRNQARSVRDARNKIREDLHLPQSATVSEDRIIAKMTFGFWTNLFSAAYEVNRNPQSLWPALLRPVFPNAPKGARNRAIIQGKLLTIKTFRNKAFHHEPVWNIGRPAQLQDAINRLIDTMDLILELIGWMSLDSVELIEKAGYVTVIRRTCSNEHLEYLRKPGANDLPLSRVKRDLRGILRRPNQTTDVIFNGSRIGKVLGK